MRSRLMRSRSLFREGTVTPLTVLSLSMLVGIVALVVDGGTLMEDRRHIQAAADAAALAAADDLLANYPINQGIDPSGTARSSALANAAANGFNNDGVQSIVTVNTSPQPYQGGPNLGKPLPPGYVEVIVQYNAGRLFSGIFGSGVLPVRGRAVARGQWAPNSNALMVLSLNASANSGLLGLGLGIGIGNPTSAALSLATIASLNVAGGLQVNSSSANALNLSGNGLTVASINLNVAAGINPSSLLSFVMGLVGSSPSVTSSGPVADPLRYLPVPNPSQLGLSPQTVGGGSVIHLYPGVYNGGINANGYNTYVLHANSDGTPGIYYLNGQNGFQITENATVTTAANETAGVMIYNNWADANDSIAVSGTASLTLTPPSSGPYRGISIFQARGTNTNVPPITVRGNGSVNVTGTIYAAHANVSLSGGSGNLGGQIIADTMSVGDNVSITINPGSQPIANTRTLGLVE